MAEIHGVQPVVMVLPDDGFPESVEIPAGTIAVVPHALIDGEQIESLPENAIMCAGQELSNTEYPEISRLYSDTGSFYTFQLPDLRKKFIIGVNKDGILWGDGIIFHKSISQEGR